MLNSAVLHYEFKLHTTFSQITAVLATVMFKLSALELCCICCIGEEVTQLEVLEGQWRAALDKLKHKKKQTRQLEEDLQVRHLDV